MSGIKISALNAVPSAQLTDVVPAVQSGVTYKESLQQILTLFNSNIQITESQVTGLTADLASKLSLSGGTMTGILNMGSHLITNVLNPINPQDAATRAYVDAAISGSVNPGLINQIAYYAASGSTLSGLATANNGVLVTSAGGVPSIGSTLPSAVQSNITQLGAQSVALNMNTHQINNVTDPTSAQDAVTLHYLNNSLGAYLPLVGGTMSGIINMGNNKITNVTNPSAGQDAVTLSYLNTALGSYLPLSGGTMSGVINMGSHKITNLTDPTNPQDAATRAYVDSVASGFAVQPAVAVATTANLNATYANGASGIGATLTNTGALTALVIDGYTVATNDRVLVKNQTSTFQNGIYVATNVGSGAVAWILTRATDYDQPAEIQPGDLVIVNNGSTYAGTSFIETATVTTIGTDPILFSQFTFSATAVLLKANNLSDVANTTTSFNNISPLTTKGDLLGYNSGNVRVAVGGTDGQILRVKSAAATGWAWSTATYPETTTVNQILYSSSTNVIGGITASAGGVLVTDASSVPQLLANPSVSGKLLASVNGAIPIWSTPTYPTVSGTARKIIVSDGTNNVYSTETWAVPGTSGNVLTSDGTNWTSAAPAAAASVTITNDTTTNATMYPTWVTANSGNLPLKVTSTKLSFNPSTGTLTLVGPLQSVTQINDANGNVQLGFAAIASAVNYVQITNASSAAAQVGVAAVGSSASVVMSVSSKNSAIYFQDTAVAAQTRWYNAGNTHYIGLQAGTLSADTTFTLPTADGAANRPMLTNGSGAFIFTPSSAGVDIVGTTTNGNAAAGSVGEFVSSVIAAASAVTAAHNTNFDLTSISLTAGDWDVFGNINYSTLGTAPVQVFAWISTTSATTPDGSLINQISGTGLANQTGLSAPTRRMSVASTTTVYISGALINTSGNGTACGGLYARRVR